MLKYIPGTALSCNESSTQSAYEIIKPFFSLTSGITLAQVRELTGLETSTIQNWVRRGWVASPINKRYGERQVIRIILINSIRRSMRIDMVISLMTYINGDVEDVSDDTVSDAALFDEFCAAVFECDKRQTYDPRQIESIIDTRLDEIDYLEAEGKIKLKNTLKIMVQAFLAALLQEKVDEEFNKLLA